MNGPRIRPIVILAAAVELRRRLPRLPTTQEIAGATALPKSTVNYYLRSLEASHRVRRHFRNQGVQVLVPPTADELAAVGPMVLRLPPEEGEA